MRLNYLSQIAIKIFLATVLTVAPSVKGATESKPKKPVRQNITLDQLLREIPKIEDANASYKAVDELISKCDGYISILSTKLTEIKEINGRLSGYSSNLSSIEELFQAKRLVTKAKTECITLLDKIKAEEHSTFKKARTRAENILANIKNAEPEIKKELETVYDFLQRFEKIKDLVKHQNYYEANDKISSLLSDIKKFNPRYDPELSYRANRRENSTSKPAQTGEGKGIVLANDDLKAKYDGRKSLEKDVSSYKSRKIAPEISKIDDIVQQFNSLCKNYDRHVQKQDVDKLLEYDTTLQKMKVIVSKRPYSSNTGFCNQVKEKDKQLYATLRSLAKIKFSEYKAKITEVGKRIESENLSQDEMNRAISELTRYNELLKKYKNTLFSKKYLANSK